jgi:O-methyltransferase domain
LSDSYRTDENWLIYSPRDNRGSSRPIIIESVLPEGNTFHPGKMLDITMLATTPGQERTEPEYRALLEKANFKLNRVIPTNSAVSIVEAIPV